MKILITGGSGFLGKNLAIGLSKDKKNKIFILDKNNPKIKSNNIFFIKCNLSNKNILFKIKKNFDYIYHMAAELGVKNVIDNPIKTVDINYVTTMNILDFAKKNKKLKRFFFFSTSEVYSKLNSKEKMSEKDKLELPEILHPRTSYWISKITGEFLTINSKIPYTIFRIFNVYGPNNKTSHVIPAIFKKLRSNRKVIFQNPTHFRSFIYIKDFVKILLISMQSQFKNKIINVGNPYESIQIKKLVGKIHKISMSKTKYKFINFPNQSIKKRIPDINKLNKLIKRKFKFTKLSNGLTEIYAKKN